MKKYVLGFIFTFCILSIQAQSVSISEIQGMSDSSPYVGQVVETSGLVHGVSSNGYFILDAEESWSGIFVFDNANVPEIGDEVALIAEVDEYYEMTELKNVSSFTTLSENNNFNLYSPIMIEDALSEEHEGCLVHVFTTCIEGNNEYGEASLSVDGSNAVVKANDLMYLYDFEVGTDYSVTGLVEYSFGEYKICPRDEGDVFSWFSVAEGGSIANQIQMINNNIVVESNVNDLQEFEVYDMRGAQILQGQFMGEVVIPMHEFQKATYIVKVGASTKLVAAQ